MTGNRVLPPAHLAPYVHVLGEELAITFLLTFGGAELYLGANPRAENRVVEVVGVDFARALALAHLPRRVPTGKPWIAQVWRSDGLSVAEIARRLHVTDVSVRRWTGAEAPPPRKIMVDDRQLPLF